MCPLLRALSGAQGMSAPPLLSMEPVAQLSTEQSLLSEDGLVVVANDNGIPVGESSTSHEEEFIPDGAATAVVEDGALSHNLEGGVYTGMALPDDACLRAAELYGTPLYLYSAPILAARASEALAFPSP